MKATKYQKKSLIKLEDLLRRRKTNLKKFLVERGITTYSALEATCNRLGVVTPAVDVFEQCVPSYVSDPTAGVVVVPPLDVVAESSGKKENQDEVFAAIPPTSAYQDISSHSDYENEEDSESLKSEQDLDGKSVYNKKKMKRGG